MKLDYKWVALSNTTLGDADGDDQPVDHPDRAARHLPRHQASIRWSPGNTSYLLWMILGFLVVTAVLLVSLGRLGDITAACGCSTSASPSSRLLDPALDHLDARHAPRRCWLIVMRLGPGHRRRAALRQLERDPHRRVPARPARARARRQRDRGDRRLVPRPRARRRAGARSLAARSSSSRCRSASVGHGLGLPQRCASWRAATAGADRLVGKRHVRGRPRRGDGRDHLRDPALRRPHDGLDEPVRGLVHRGSACALLAAFCLIERRVAEPMFHLELFRIRAFTAGNIASLLAAMGRGGLQFILIIWLQGIWLPEHGYDFSQTPLWAGIYMLPADRRLPASPAPTSGYLSDRFGARPFATGGMLIAALSFVLLIALPVDFPYWWFALILLLNGIGQGLFSLAEHAPG